MRTPIAETRTPARSTSGRTELRPGAAGHAVPVGRRSGRELALVPGSRACARVARCSNDATLQAGKRTRGGWNTPVWVCTGRGAVVAEGRKERPAKAEPGADEHQAQDSDGPSNWPAGTTGVAGCPEHHAPEQGRGGRGMGSGSDRRTGCESRGRPARRSAPDRSGTSPGASNHPPRPEVR
jgi:hypothetical protein